MNLKKLTIIAISVLLIIGFMVLAYIMSNRLGKIAEDETLSMASIIARTNGKVAETQFQKPLKLGKKITRELSKYENIEDGIAPLKKVMELSNIIDANIVRGWIIREKSDQVWTLTNYSGSPDSIAMKLGKKSMVTEKRKTSNPYFSPVDSVYSVCFALPFRLKNREKGVALIEMNLDKLHESFINIESFGYGYISIVSKDGKYVSHPEKSFIGKNALEIEKHSLLDTVLKSKDTLAAKVMSEYLAIDVYRIFLPMELADSLEYWRLMVSVPYLTMSEISDKVSDSSLVVGIVGSICLIVIIALFIRQLIFELSKRLKAEDTNRKLQLMQNKLLLSEKMASLGELTAGIAHEMNNPLNFIVANISPLKRDFEKLKKLYTLLFKVSGKKPEYENLVQKAESEGVMYLLEESNELIDSIEEGAKRTASIVSGLYDFSRLDTEEKINTDINESIRATLNLMQYKTRDIKINLQLNDIPPLKGQPGKLQQVFMNFISNAIQAIEEKRKTQDFEPEMLIKTMQVEDSIEIIFEDNGQGIEKKHIKKIYDPFFTTKGVGEGVGLGLSISYGIIRQHNGKVELKSKYGKGTRFKVYLKL